MTRPRRIDASSRVPMTRAYLVRVELDGPVSGDEVHADLTEDPAHQLSAFRPQITTAPSGHPEVGLVVPGPDVWTSVLTAMALLRQSGYDLHALHVVSLDQDRPAA